MGLTHLYKINKTDMSITCIANNRQILFSGLDDVEKLKSISPINSVLHRIFLEEATEIKYEAYKQLEKRLRGRAEYKKMIILAFNPVLKTSWIYKEFFKRWEDNKNLYEDDKLLILKTTYKDNLYLEPEDIQRLEDETDPYYYSVYSLGNWGVLANTIYRNWRVEDLSSVKHSFDNIQIGVDFGFSNPNAVVKAHVDLDRKKIYIIDEIYKRGQDYEELAEDIKRIAGNTYVTCDSADPRAIAMLTSLGVRTLASAKGSNSVLFGIKWLQSFEIIIDVSCQNFKNEIEQYHWQEDNQGNVLERPVKQNDHCLTGDTIVNTPSGDFAIKDLVGKTGEVYCYDETNKCKTVSEFYDCRLTQQNVEVYEIELEDGRTIKATAEHPILTQRGWATVENLKESDSILDIFS